MKWRKRLLRSAPQPPEKPTTYEIARAKEHAYALSHGMFWLPCPLCGEDFGGHEWGGSIYNGINGLGFCSKPECKARAKELTAIGVRWEHLNTEHEIGPDGRLRSISRGLVPLSNMPFSQWETYVRDLETGRTSMPLRRPSGGGSSW